MINDGITNRACGKRGCHFTELPCDSRIMQPISILHGTENDIQEVLSSVKSFVDKELAKERQLEKMGA